MSSLALDAEALYGELARGVRALLGADTQLAGVVSGGAWLAERLQRDLGRAGAAGALSSALHRDDFAKRGLSAHGQTVLPFEVTVCAVVSRAIGPHSSNGRDQPLARRTSALMRASSSSTWNGFTR